MKGRCITTSRQLCSRRLREQLKSSSSMLCPHFQRPMQPMRSFSSAQKLAAVELEQQDKRERVVVLGSGWAGFVFARNLNPKKYKITVISPRTYFVFTPLLTDTAVGTLEFRNVLESIRRSNDIEYIQAWADDINFVAKTVQVEPAVLDPSQSLAQTGSTQHGQHTVSDSAYISSGTQISADHVPTFPVQYDKLIVTVGSYSQTFNTPGIRENAYFLKDVGDARKIRKRILELFELCQMPYLSDETRRHLLHFCIVGAGPTGMEFAGNLSDLVSQDLAKMHPNLMQFVKISLYDVAPKILPMFDAALAEYAEKQYIRNNIDVRTSHHVELLRKGPPGVQSIDQDQLPDGRVYTLKTTEGGEVGCGMCIWSTGLMANPFIEKALNHVRRFPRDSAKITEGRPVDESNPRQWVIQRNAKTGSMIVDDHFRVRLQTEAETPARAVMEDVFAFGDCTHLDGVEPPLPATAQVANQEALFLAQMFNKHHGSGKLDLERFGVSKGFSFHNRGVMTFLGGGKAVLQAPSTSRKGAARGLKGWLAYLIWRGAYLTMTLSWRNKFLIPVQWLAVKVFGRSISRF